METRYFIALARREQVEPYLYAHSKIILSITVPGVGQDHFAQLIHTYSGTGNANFLANYQRDRLGSGLIPCLPICSDFHNAIDSIASIPAMNQYVKGTF